MAKLNLKDATRELLEGASGILEQATRVRKNADSLFGVLKQMDADMNRQREEEASRKRQQEQLRAQSSHTKAFTMLDDDEKQLMEAAMREEASRKGTESEQTREIPAQKAEPVSSAAPESKPEQKAAPETTAEKVSEPKPAEMKPAEPKSAEPKPAEAKTAEGKTEEQTAAEKKPEEAKTAESRPEETKADAGEQTKAPVRKPETKPEQKPEAPKKPAIGQIISRPGDVQKPTQPAAGRPGQYGRPAGQQGPYGRPAGQQGQFARPAGQQGPYGRPAGQQGQFARPAGQQQGPYGRPAGQQGQFARPTGQQQGPYGRPAGQQGTFGRPAGAAGTPRPGGNMQGGRPQTGGRGTGMSRTRTPELAVPMEKERVSNYDPNKKNYVRQHDPEHVTRNRKQASKNSGFNGYDDEVIRGGKRSRAKKPSAQQMMAPIRIESATMAGDRITVRDLTEKIGKPAGEIIKKLIMLGNMATINSEIDFDTAQLVCSDFDITLERKQEQTAEAALVAEDFDDAEENLSPRPPVVTIMGHVDHGKTSLLDYIRKSRVTAGEAGGITQHIGAYTVSVNDRQITFLDTPGHEAFTAMRARGTQATDIAVLVVAADDSVMPQTVESINHAKAAEVPIIVAINKMDKPEANPEKVKQDLTQYGLVCEDWGGETICVPVSAHTGEGVEELLEMILLQADMLQLQANPNRLGRGVIIEAKLDKARGPLATVLLQNGTLHVGDSIIAGMASGKVRALINDRGERVESAGPSMPVEIMGFDDVPSAGDEMVAVGDDRLSRQVADERREKLRASREATMAKMSMENLFSTIEAGKVTTLNLIIKADVQGSVEAVKQAMEKLSGDEVKIRVLHSAAGAITKDDVNLASAFNAIIIGFNIRPDASARETAEKAKVDIRLYTVIYKAIEDMELAMKGLLAPEYREVLLGHAEVRNVFRITGAGIIAGCYVQDGKMQRNASVRLLRDNVVVFEGKLSSLRHLKDDVKEMAAGYECGMSLEGHNDIKEGDIVECYIMEEIPR